MGEQNWKMGETRAEAQEVAGRKCTRKRSKLQEKGRMKRGGPNDRSAESRGAGGLRRRGEAAPNPPHSQMQRLSLALLFAP